MTDGRPNEFPIEPVVSNRQARISWRREKLIAQEEVALLRQKLRECTQREHLNKIQRCRKEAIEYMEALNKYKKGLKLTDVAYNFIVLTIFLQEEILMIALCLNASTCTPRILLTYVTNSVLSCTYYNALHIL